MMNLSRWRTRYMTGICKRYMSRWRDQEKYPSVEKVVKMAQAGLGQRQERQHRAKKT
jgi:hypothetical protein